MKISAINSAITNSLPKQIGHVCQNVPSIAKTAEHKSSLMPKFLKKSYDYSIETLAGCIGKLAQKDKTKRFTEWCVNKDINYTNHLAAVVSNIQNGFYMYNVAKSQKIEEDQKKPLMLNMFIGTMLATVGGYTINKGIDKRLFKVEKAISKNYPKNEAILTGFKVARSLMIFQLLYRFVTPVIATPVANYISDKQEEKKKLNI